MHKAFTRFIAVMLTAVMFLQVSDGVLAYAAEDPTGSIELTVPESLQDGQNYFFIRQESFTISEKSREKLYIPIQRTGDTGDEAEVTLKVIDMSARWGENYTADIYRDRQDPEAVHDGLNVRDLFENADEQEESEALDENELGEILTETGGAEIVTPDGEPVGTVTAVPLDENGEPIPQDEDDARTDDQGEPAAEGTSLKQVNAGPAQTAGVEEASSPSELMAARNAFTGNVSDRQQLAGGDGFFSVTPAEKVQVQEQRQLTDEDLLEESYPGREFRVHFAPGQTAQFLVIEPKYSEAADGDCSIMLMLKGLPENAFVPEGYNMRTVLITDEDEPQPVTISMAEAEIVAENGVASVTVTRSGQLNNLVGVMLSSQDGSAKAGDDFSGVGAKLWFSMGMTTRTVQLPVGHGAEDRDFTLTISALPDGADVNIGRSTSHVVIPAAEKTGDAALMDDEDDRYGEAWNLRDRKLTLTSSGRFDSDTTVYLPTEDDKTQTQYISLTTDSDYAWDGVHVDYDFYTWYAKGYVRIQRNYGGGWENAFYKDWEDLDEEWKNGQTADAFFGGKIAPFNISIDNRAYEVHNGFRDSYTALRVNQVRPIKRNFTIKLDNTAALAFEGMTDKEVLEQYQPVILDDSLETTRTCRTLDNFSVSCLGATEWARMTALYAVTPDGKSKLRIAAGDGKSGTISCRLSTELINHMAEKGVIDWKESDGSYSGTITVRPEFKYVKDVAVKVRETPEGTLKYNGRTLEPGTHTFHYGDRLTFEPNVSDASAAMGIRATGIGYESRRGGAAGTLTGKTDCTYFTDQNVTITLTEDYYEFWQVFSEATNAVRVRVPSDEVQYFDTTKGLFAGAAATEADGYTVYEVKTGVLTSEFTELLALARDETHIPVWTVPNNSNTYSGSGFCFFAGVKAEDNLVTLRMDRNANTHAWYSVSGTACSATLNLTTGNDADDLFPVEGAVFTTGSSGAVSDENGAFTMQPVYLVGGSCLRYAVSYNGNLSIRETGLAPANAAKKSVEYMQPDGSYGSREAVSVSLGNVQLSGRDPTAAHFSGVDVKLDGFNSSAARTMEMNGKKLTLTIKVDPGQKYIFDGQEYEEHITDVTLYFQSQITGVIHGVDSTSPKDGEGELKWDAAANTATLTIDKFSPDAPEKYTWGDVLMLQLATDKKVNAAQSGGMTYQPVSSGYAVVSDRDYQPETFDYSLDIQSLFQTSAAGGGDSGNTRYTFGKFPWLGEITAVIKTFSYFTAGASGTARDILDDLAAIDSEGILAGDDGGDARLFVDDNPNALNRRWALSAAVAFKETPYGGVRTMITVAGTIGNNRYMKNAVNPYRSYKEYTSFQRGVSSSTAPAIETEAHGIEYIYHKKKPSASNLKNDIKSQLGGPYIYFTVYVGVYIDWGFIEVTKTDGSSPKTEISHEACYLGAGGFIGARLTGGYTQYVFIPFTVYFNIEANVNATVFLGSSADPNKTLKSFYETTDHKGQDFAFNVEVVGGVGAKLSIGAGYYKIIGIRANGGIGLEAGYSMRMKQWFPNLEGADTLSYSTDATFSGTIDVVFTSIDLWSASWPLPLGRGWLQFFQQSRRANTLILLINKNINSGKGSEGARAQCRTMTDELGKYVDAYQGTGDQLKAKVDALRDYARANGLLTWTDEIRVDMIRQGGIIGNTWDSVTAWVNDDEGSDLFHTRDHVATRWVAGENASLQAAFGPVSSGKLVENAVSQPAAQIMAIGANQFLVVFLDDDPARERQQAGVLKWTVYDADKDSWTEPKVLQDDGTGDSRANLVDAGDKLVLSWASIEADKYFQLKEAVADLLEKKNGSKPAEEQVQAALEADPALVMAQMDIFTVQFDKQSGTFGEIEQLTDDDLYDDAPQAVYDSETGDYIVLYCKTAQEHDVYENATNRLMDIVGANTDPGKTYSVLCYMLYNNQTDAKDTEGYAHDAGWARDYLFPNETSQSLEDQWDFLAQWDGQRILNSAIRTEDGGQTDMPISDLTVCNGYNGLASFAFTVDKDYNVDTGEDRELFVQFYDFKSHSVYVPIKVAGEAGKMQLIPPTREKQADGSYLTTTPASVAESTEAVNVGQPRLIRNEGSTWLFWREDNDGLRYLNISEMLNDKVETGKGDDDWTYAVKGNGTFAVDSSGEAYTPKVQSVDFGSAMTENDLDITDYQVITDRDDNLYVVWTDIFEYDDTDNEYDETISSPAQAIYATAKIRESGGRDEEESADTASWSKPYRLTRDNSSNDGVAVALDDNGGLILIHNQYQLELADTEEEMNYMVSHNLAGVYTDEQTGKSYFLGYPYYPTDMSLMLTRCEAIGSVEATQFTFSDDTPAAGEQVEVTAVIENAGLTSAAGATVDFYTYKDGRQGEKLSSVSIDEAIPVNTARETTFQWTVPADGPEGYSIQAVAREKKGGLFGGSYDPTETFSDVFRARPEYTLALDSCVQNGDVFDVKYTVKNTGSLAVPDGVRANLCLEGLYGDLKEQYGMDTDLLAEEDISGLAPGETRTVERSITLPVSVFRFCGYDSVTVRAVDPDGAVLETTDDSFITLDEPLNLTLNGGQGVTLMSGESRTAEASYESTVFMDQGGVNAAQVVYAVDDPSVASVDENGVVTGLSSGSAILTATLLPSGRSVSVPVTVSGGGNSGSGGSSGGGGGSAPAGNPVNLAAAVENGSAVSSASSARPGQTVTITVKPDEGCQTAAVNVTDAKGTAVAVKDNGDGTWSFTMPDSAVSVTPVFTKIGQPADGGTCPKDASCPISRFTDAKPTAWYHDGVHWALDEGIMNGVGDDRFAPNDSATRAMVVTMLWRLEGEPDGMPSPFTDVSAGSWYEKAVNWAAETGVVKGVTETEFCPDMPVTREQLAAILYRCAQAKRLGFTGTWAFPLDYSDAADVSEYAYEAMCWMTMHGVINGMGDGTLAPRDNATRAQIATMFLRFCGEAEI